VTTTKTLEEGLVAYLLSQADIAAVVSDRVRTGVARQNEQRPFLVVGPPTIEPQYTAAGGAGLAESRIEVHCEAASYREARELAELIRKKFKDGFQGNMEGVEVRALYATVRGNTPRVVSGDQEGFRSVTVELQVFHEEPP